jgi:signal transduction histidine kinase
MATRLDDRQVNTNRFLLGARWAFGLLVVFLGLMSVGVLFLAKDTQERLRDSTYDRGGLSGVQIRTHYERLMGALAVLDAGLVDASPDTVILEFDILYERIKAQPTRPPNDQFNDPDYLALLTRVEADLRQYIPVIDRAADGDIGALDGLRLALKPLRPDIGRVASSTTQHATDLRDSVRQSNVSRTDHVIWLILGMIGLSLVFVLTIWLQFSRLEKQRVSLVRLADRLQQASHDAMQANNAKSEFLAHMSHELRTPLNSILGFSEIIRDGVMGKTEPPVYAGYAANIHESSQLLLELINDLLDLSQIEAKKFKLNEEEFDLLPVIERTIRLIENRANCGGIIIDSRPIAWDGSVLADSGRVHQMLLNLLDNAIKFSDPGGRIEIGSQLQVNGDLSIFVRDKGRGISPENLDAVLEPFHRGDAESYQATSGVGLGLAIVQSMIKMHEGSLVIESQAGVGTTVELRFPARRICDRDRHKGQEEDLASVPTST